VTRQRFRESKIEVEMLPPNSHKGKPTELFQVVIQENVIKWQVPGRGVQKQAQQLSEKHK